MVLGIKSIWSSLKFRFYFVKPPPLLYLQKYQCVKFRKKCFRKRFFFRTEQNKLFFASVELAIAQASNRRLHKCWFDRHTRVDSTIAQASIQQLCKHQIDDCTSVELTCWITVEAMIVRASNRRLQSSNRRLYWLFLKKDKDFSMSAQCHGFFPTMLKPGLKW